LIVLIGARTSSKQNAINGRNWMGYETELGSRPLIDNDWYKQRNSKSSSFRPFSTLQLTLKMLNNNQFWTCVPRFQSNLHRAEIPKWWTFRVLRFDKTIIHTYFQFSDIQNSLFKFGRMLLRIVTSLFTFREYSFWNRLTSYSLSHIWPSVVSTSLTLNISLSLSLSMSTVAQTRRFRTLWHRFNLILIWTSKQTADPEWHQQSPLKPAKEICACSKSSVYHLFQGTLQQKTALLK
jgi:hypothetical protein